MLNERVVFLDLETTGGSAAYDRIIEIGLVEIDRGRFVAEWSTLVNPGRPIPRAIQFLTGITNEMVVSAPSFEEVCGSLARRLEGKILAAHNARFDYGFLKAEFRRAGASYVAPVLCTVKLSRRLFPQHRRHNLDALIVRHALFCIDRHRALGDARVLWELAQIWGRDLDETALNGACAELLRRAQVPAALPPDLFDTLPETTGFYVFYGESDVALYVGRATNIRSRVMAHFTANRGGGKDAQLTNETKRVDWIETAGELGAGILEARLVKALSPVFNRTRDPAELLAWRWRIEDPATPPWLVNARAVDINAFGELYGLFRSRATAREALRALADRYRLCRVALGLEPRQGNPCGAYLLERCRGACIGAESAISHAMRVVQALSGLRMRPWPYSGRIAVSERDHHRGRTELHVFDRWCHIATVNSENELYQLPEPELELVFDPDTYRMLARFLKSPPRSCDIIALDARPVGLHCARRDAAEKAGVDTRVDVA